MNYCQVQRLRKQANGLVSPTHLVEGEFGTFGDHGLVKPPQGVPGMTPKKPAAPAAAPQQPQPQSQPQGWWNKATDWLLPVGMSFMGMLNMIKGNNVQRDQTGVQKQLAAAREDLANTQLNANNIGIQR